MIFAQQAIVIQMVFWGVSFFFPGSLKAPPSDHLSAPSLFPPNMPSLAVNLEAFQQVKNILTRKISVTYLYLTVSPAFHTK